jgi:CheY-like chemotaxis protein
MKKILVIDDNKDVREVLSSLLRVENYEIIEAENGLIGTELARQVIPDLIISDVIMPDMDGFDTLTELRKDPVTAHIPFIFLTAMTGKTAHILGLGAEEYLTKPIEMDLLLSKINAQLYKI